MDKGGEWWKSGVGGGGEGNVEMRRTYSGSSLNNHRAKEREEMGESHGGDGRVTWRMEAGAKRRQKWNLGFSVANVSVGAPLRSVHQ